MTKLRLTNSYILLFIIIAASILRLYHFNEIPFTHDEFSALFRTHFDSFRELIEKGVKPDGHPAGVQVFLYYWTKLTGMKEWAVKLPFAIMGIWSVYLIYVVAKEWFNETVALISATFMSSLQFAVMYSQIARPYISGLFFSLLVILFWTKIVQPSPKHFLRNLICYIIASSLCTYNHHFSLLFAAIVGFSGLFFVQKKYMPKYIFGGILIFVLYVPHLGIFFHQLHTGGLEGWLGKPGNTFIVDYLCYIFNFSWLAISLAICLSLWGLMNKQGKGLKLHILFLAWFILPFLIGFFYSKYVNPVLQFSVLIFSFYALFFFMFGPIKEQKPVLNLIIVVAILSANIYSLVVVRQHYRLLYNSNFEKIVVDCQKAKQDYKGVISIIDVTSRKITAYYLSKHNAGTGFVWHDSFEKEADLVQFLKEQKSADYLYLGCVSSNPPTTVPIILDYFPVIKEQNNYFCGTTYVFSKKGEAEVKHAGIQDFEKGHSENWNGLDDSKYIDSVSYEGKYSYLIDSLTEWSPTYTNGLYQVISGQNNFIDISVKVRPAHKIHEAILVAALETSGVTTTWQGVPFERCMQAGVQPGNWETVYCSLKLSDAKLGHKSPELKIYIWNKGHNTFLIDDIKINARAGNPFVYGLYEKF